VIGDCTAREVAEHRGDAIDSEQVTQLRVGKTEDVEHGRAEESRCTKRQSEDHLAREDQNDNVQVT
jgi:hypothetical protein